MKNLWYRLSCRLWYRYNVVVCRWLPSIWCDRDYLLLYSSFQILEDFIHKEIGHFQTNVYELYRPDCGHEEAKRRAKEWSDLKSLYGWWVERRESRYKDSYEEDTTKLCELAKLRHLLWT